MPQVTLYIDEETDRKMRRAARAAGVSRSRWVARAIRKNLASEWPDSFLALAGAWPDFPSAKEIRRQTGTDTRREHL
jgi:hypothetical protein